MKLPNGEHAYVPPGKLTEYLLSESHPIGRSKSGLLRAVGFNEANAELLEQRLLDIAHSGKVQEVVASPHGVKYVVDGALSTPAGTVVQLRTIWIIETGQDCPRLVTAYPA